MPRKAAIKTPRNRHVISLEPLEYELLLAALDAPPTPNKKLRRLMQNKNDPWHKQRLTFTLGI